MATSFWEDFRRFFVRGLAAVLPTVLTLALIVWVFSKIQQYVGRYINLAAARLVTQIIIWQKEITNPDQASLVYSNVQANWDRYWFWVGFVLAIVGVYIFGRFLASFLGRAIWRLTERGLLQLPLIKQIYPSVKQVTDFLLAERKVEYSKVVAVEYPRKGIWSLGLVTNYGMRTLDENLQGQLVTIFVPSSPTPVTGYTITVRRDEVIDLPISIDEALRFTVSGGVILPSNQYMGELPIGPAEKSFFSNPSSDKEMSE